MSGVEVLFIPHDFDRSVRRLRVDMGLRRDTRTVDNQKRENLTGKTLMGHRKSTKVEGKILRQLATARGNRFLPAL